MSRTGTRDRPDEVIGKHFSRFYTEEDRAAGVPKLALETAERAPQVTRLLAVETGLRLVDHAKIVRAASALARNILDYSGTFRGP